VRGATSNGRPYRDPPDGIDCARMRSLQISNKVHAYAGQLVLIRRWIAMQVDLLDRLAAHLRIARILKGRIITDLVSFCDCLMTRPVSTGAPQAMVAMPRSGVGATFGRDQIGKTAKPKRPTSTVTAQPMQAADFQDRGREPDPLGELLRGLFWHSRALT
jgi:hypothetical protein